MFDQVTDDVWVERRPLRFLGVETGTKMTIVKLSNGDLFVHSPVVLDESARAGIEELGGRVAALVAPTLFHHLFIGEWAKAFPKATLSCCPGLQKKRADVAWTRVLDKDDQPGDEWKGEMEQVCFTARSMENEVIFFHKKSKTIVSSDFMFNLSTHPSGLTRAVAWLIGNRDGRPGTTLLERVMIRKRDEAKEQVARIAAWNPDRIVLAHGDNVYSNAKEHIERAYEWL